MKSALENYGRTILASCIQFILVANMFSKSVVGYALVPFLLCLLCVAFSKTEKFSWRDLLPTTGFDWLFLALFPILLVSHLVNGTFGKHEFTELSEYRWLFVVYLVAGAFKFTRITVRGVTAFSFLIGALSLYCLVHFAFYGRLDLSVFGWPNRMEGFLQSPTDFAHAMQFLCIFCVVLLSLPISKTNKTLFFSLLFGLIFSAINLYFSYTRIAIASVFVSVGVFFLLFNRKILKKGLLSISGIFIIAFTTNLLGFRDRIMYTFTSNEATDVRIQLWKYNWDIFVHNPFFGVGYHHNFIKYHPEYTREGIAEHLYSAHAHNQVLNFLSGVGVFGAVWFLAVMVLFGKLALENIKKFEDKSLNYALAVSSFILLVAFMLSGLADTNFELIAPRYFLGFTWALIVFQKHQSQDLKVRSE